MLLSLRLPRSARGDGGGAASARSKDADSMRH
jgi:hypothetical protein